jgi:hypothetical protein
VWIILASCHAHSALKWEQTSTLWNFNFILDSDVGMTLSPEPYFSHWHIPFNPAAYDHVKAGDIVWVQSWHFLNFYYYALPRIQVPFVLVINDGDAAFPSDFSAHFSIEAFLHHPHILHVFAQNCDYKGPARNISPIPIGLDFHSVAYKNGMWGDEGSPQEQEAHLNALLSTLKPTHLRKRKAFVDFQHSDTMRNNPRYHGENRTLIFNALRDTGAIDFGPILPRAELWKTKGEYAFSISPHGNGWDCHRTWEDLMLGCIVIVKTSPLDRLYEGLPVVIVQDWSEVTPQQLERWLERFGDAFTNPAYREKLTNAYWHNLIHSKTRSP